MLNQKRKYDPIRVDLTPDRYRIIINSITYSIPRSYLPTLEDKETTTDLIKVGLNRIIDLTKILESNNQTFQDIHIALLKARNAELAEKVKALSQRNSQFFSSGPVTIEY